MTPPENASDGSQAITARQKDSILEARRPVRVVTAIPNNGNHHLPLKNAAMYIEGVKTRNRAAAIGVVSADRVNASSAMSAINVQTLRAMGIEPTIADRLRGSRGAPPQVAR